MTIAQFQKNILDWYRNPPAGGAMRSTMPWRRTRDPYKILVSEVMLQQTQIARVLPKYKEFLGAFPDLASLAAATDKRLLKVWAGLGYWRRAKYLKKTAQLITNNYNGKFPKDPKILETFPGIGPYTARALACFAFGSREAFLDTNIRRVYLHFFFPRRKNVSDKEILRVAQRAIDTLPKNVSSREWHYALFDYGATVLKDKQINRRRRHNHKQSKFEGSFRSFRTAVVQYLLSQPQNRTPQKKVRHVLEELLKKEKTPYSAQEILDSLLKDRLIKKSRTHYYL